MSDECVRDQKKDATIDAIHQTRERLSDASGNDIRAISAAARERQAQSGHPVVSYSKREEVTSGVLR